MTCRTQRRRTLGRGVSRRRRSVRRRGGAGAGEWRLLAASPSSELERVLTAAIKLYAAKAEAEERFPAPVSAEKITPTEIVLVVSEMLRAADISLFDLAMWYRRGERA